MYSPPNTVKARRQKFWGRRTTVWNNLPVELRQQDICLTEFWRLIKTVLFRWDSAHCDFFVLMAPGISTLTYLLTFAHSNNLTCDNCTLCMSSVNQAVYFWIRYWSHVASHLILVLLFLTAGMFPEWIRIDWQSRISDMTSYFQDGRHDVISRKALACRVWRHWLAVWLCAQH